MSVSKILTENKYIIEKDKFCIYLIIKNKDKYTILPKKPIYEGTNIFKFENSKPEVIRAIGELLIEASNIKE